MWKTSSKRSLCLDTEGGFARCLQAKQLRSFFKIKPLQSSPPGPLCFSNGLLIGFRGRGSSLGEHQPLGKLQFLISLASSEAELSGQWGGGRGLFALVSRRGPDVSERSGSNKRLNLPGSVSPTRLTVTCCINQNPPGCQTAGPTGVGLEDPSSEVLRFPPWMLPLSAGLWTERGCWSHLASPGVKDTVLYCFLVPRPGFPVCWVTFWALAAAATFLSPSRTTWLESWGV